MKDNREKIYSSILRMTLTTILLLSFSTCLNNNSTSELKQYFTKNQIKNLNQINNFFISDYLKSNKEDFSQAFKNMFKQVSINGIDTLLNHVDFEKQRKLYSSIPNTFKEIWEVNQIATGMYKGEEYIIPKYKGQFQSYIKHLGQTNLLAADCWNQMELAGDFNQGSLNFYISQNYDTIDYDDFNNQIIISIYYLTLIDNYERDKNTKKRIQEYNEKVKRQFTN